MPKYHVSICPGPNSLIHMIKEEVSAQAIITELEIARAHDKLFGGLSKSGFYNAVPATLITHISVVLYEDNPQ